MNESASTGVRLTGFNLTQQKTDFEERYNVRWCFERQIIVVTPADVVAEACVLTGFNPFGLQQVELSSKGNFIARVDIPHGHFTVGVNFSKPIYPKTEIQFALQFHLPRDEAHGKAVSIALGRIVYSGPSFLDLPLLGPESTIDLAHNDLLNDVRFLSLGWSSLEEDRVWSINVDAFICLRLSDDVERIAFEVSGNPFVPMEESELEVEINGRSILKAALAVERTSLVFDRVNGGWKTQLPNLVVFRVNSLGKPPSDERTLGICLYKISLS